MVFIIYIIIVLLLVYYKYSIKNMPKMTEISNKTPKRAPYSRPILLNEHARVINKRKHNKKVSFNHDVSQMKIDINNKKSLNIVRINDEQ